MPLFMTIDPFKLRYRYIYREEVGIGREEGREGGRERGMDGWVVGKIVMDS